MVGGGKTRCRHNVQALWLGTISGAGHALDCGGKLLNDMRTLQMHTAPWHAGSPEYVKKSLRGEERGPAVRRTVGILSGLNEVNSERGSAKFWNLARVAAACRS